MTTTLESFVGSCAKKLQDIVTEEAILILGVKEELIELQRKMEQIQCFLHDAEQRSVQESAVKNWLCQLRDAVYDADDIIDLAKSKASKLLPDQSSSFSGSSKTCSGLSLSSCFSNIQTRHEVAIKIKNLNKRIDNILKDKVFTSLLHWKKVFTSLTSIRPTVTVSVPKQTRSSSLIEPNLVGKEVIHACKNIVDLVLAQKENRCYKLAIVGTGGVGKTTLAQKIYNDQKLKGSFNIHAWVCVSNDFSEIDILKEILRKINVEYLQDEVIDELQSKLESSIQDKTFFLVLDDVWQSDIWTNLLRIPLCAAATGVVLLTTRSYTIAVEIGVDHTHRVDLLSLDVGWELLWKSMGIKEEKQVQNLQDLGIDIVRRCGGLPLAIEVIARVLASKDHNEKEWKKILQKDAWSMTKLPSEITNALYLSYEELPYTDLKTCLLYLNVFPGNYKIDKARLIWMWIAEGFIQCEGQVNNLFELGERYFNELINRSMIQPVYNNGMIEHCYVQNMVLNLIHHLSSEENFVNILSDEYGTSTVDRMPRIRRLSIQNGKEDHTIIQITRSIMQQVRSVIVFPSAVDRMPSLGSLRDLCVLDLNDCDLSQSQILKYLGSLFYLKYLGLSNTRIAQLPEEVGNLQFLQTLSIKCNEIANLPPTIVHLKKLMCLQIDMDTRVPNGIANLTSLVELSQIGIYDSADIEALCGLTELRVLGISCYTECIDTLEKYLVDCLCKLKNVQNISIWVASGECKLDALVVPQHLCRLSLHGCWLSTLPDWVSPSSLMNLSSISIAVIQLQEEDLKNLGRMPALHYLNLKVDHENLGVLRRFIIDATLFQCLLSCVLWGFRGPVIYTQGAMPRLKSLQFTLHVRDTREIAGSSDGGYNLGIENLLSLQDVTVLFRCGGASNQEVQQVKSALRDTTKSHPNHPTIDFIGYEDKEEMINWT